MTSYKVGDKLEIVDVSKILTSPFDDFKNGDILVVDKVVVGIGLETSRVKDGVYLGLFDSELKNVRKVCSAKFNVGDKIKIINVDGIRFGEDKWQNGDITEVVQVLDNGCIRALCTKGVNESTPFMISKSEFDCIEKVEEKEMSDEDSRIAALEEEVEKLKAEVAELKGGQTTKKEPNEDRKRIINEAKEFVESKKDDEGDVYLPYGSCATPYWIVNKEKRTVVVLLHGYITGTLLAKGVAKCAPDDVFNEDIGKAIALGRALNENVSKFENAPKPGDIAVGQVVEVIVSSISGRKAKVTSMAPAFDGDRFGTAFLADYIPGWAGSKQVKIIDDTEAQY